LQQGRSDAELGIELRERRAGRRRVFQIAIARDEAALADRLEVIGRQQVGRNARRQAVTEAAPKLHDPAVRHSIEDEIERLNSLLDSVEPAPDLEPWLAGGDEVVGTDDREGDDSDDEYQSAGPRPAHSAWGRI
jgi:hypothetical protein